MEERLKELYRGVAVHATADREHMAALELLALVMLADSHLGDDELDVLRELTEDWRGKAFSFEQYLGPAVAKARQAFRDETVHEFLDDVDSRITSRILRKALFSAARQITGADGTISNGENDLLADIAVRFA
jgi:uncharacterized tellurite resistance protein B-like protein